MSVDTNKEEVQKIGYADDAQIAKWKKDYDLQTVHEIEVEKTDPVTDDVVSIHYGYFKEPNKKILSAAFKGGIDNPIRFNESIANNCWLGGDENMKSNEKLFAAASVKFGDLIKVYEAKIKKR